KLQVVPSQLLCDGIPRQVLREEPRRRNNRRAERFITQLRRRGPIHVPFHAQKLWWQIKSVRNDSQEELLPGQSQVRIRSAPETQHLRLALDRQDRHLARAFYFILPPANQPL